MMTRHTIAAVLFVSTCQLTESNPAEYVVAYTLTASAAIACDSVKYENALGDIVKVTSPALPWSYAYLGPAGTHLQVVGWIRATGSGQQAKLKATWTISGVSTAADSSVGTSTAPGAFTLVVARRQL